MTQIEQIKRIFFPAPFTNLFVISTEEKSHPESDVLYVFTLCDFFAEMTKQTKIFLMKMIALAPIEVEILLCNEMEQKIATDSGICS